MTRDPMLTLLYVEDEAIVAMVAVMALEDAGFHVEHVPDGKLAIAALEAARADYRALVTDVRLPHVDGWAIAERARRLNRTIPVVYVTADSAAQWMAMGVSNSVLLQKPFANAELVAAIGRAREYVDPP